MQEQTDSPIRTALAGGVMTVRLDRPHKKNAVSFAMWRELREIFTAVERDPDVRVIILTGGGECFSAGADISEFARLRSTPDQVAVYEGAVDGALAAIASSSKPTIAAIAGICFAGGLALAASADFRVADTTAAFSVSAVRMGLVYNIAKSARLYQIVGVAAAKRILMTGQRFDAEAARNLGLVDELAEADVLAAAHELANALMSGAPLAVNGVKSILDALASGVIGDRRPDLERRIAAADASDDHREAVRAFAEKRSPLFRGR